MPRPLRYAIDGIIIAAFLFAVGYASLLIANDMAGGDLPGIAPHALTLKQPTP